MVQNVYVAGDHISLGTSVFVLWFVFYPKSNISRLDNVPEVLSKKQNQPEVCLEISCEGFCVLARKTEVYTVGC